MYTFKNGAKIFCLINSDDPDSFKFIVSEREQCQALNNVFGYKKDCCLHAVGNTKSLFSCMKFNCMPNLLEAFAETVSLLYDKVFKPFYNTGNPRKDFVGSDEVMTSLKHVVKVNKKMVIDLRTVQFNIKLNSILAFDL